MFVAERHRFSEILRGIDLFPSHVSGQEAVFCLSSCLPQCYGSAYDYEDRSHNDPLSKSHNGSSDHNELASSTPRSAMSLTQWRAGEAIKRASLRSKS